MENVLMKKLLLLFVFVLMIGATYASDDWGDINSGSDLSGQGGAGSENDINENLLVGDNPIVPDDNDNNPPTLKYTSDFYIAIGLGFFGVLIVALFTYFFLRNPKNKWKST